MYLARDHARDELRAVLENTAKTSKREDLRGLAVAALWDAGSRDAALALSDEALKAKSLSTAVWAALVKAAAAEGSDVPVVDEPTLRRVQWGWLE